MPSPPFRSPAPKVPLPRSSRMIHMTTRATVYPSPWVRPSAAEARTPCLEAKASARPRMMQLTTIRGMNTPNPSERAGRKAWSSRSTMVTKPEMITT